MGAAMTRAPIQSTDGAMPLILRLQRRMGAGDGMNRDVRYNANLVVWHTLLLNTMFFIPVVVPYFRDSLGVDYQGFMLTQAIFSGVIILMDVPTGLLADVWTRRRIMVVGTALYAVGELLMLVVHGFVGAAIAEALLGVAVSLLSGAKMALLYDSMAEAGQGEDYSRKQGFVHGSGLYATGFSALLGGWLYGLHPALPMGLSAVMAVLAMMASCLIVEPARHREAVRKHPVADMIETMRYALHGHKEVAGIIILSGVAFTVTRVIFWAQQPYYEMLGIPTVWFGVLAGINFLIAGAGGHFSHKLDGRVGDMKALFGCLIAAFVVCLGCGLLANRAGVALIVAGGAIYGIGWARTLTAINHLVDSQRRATILSTANFMLSVFSIPLLALSGAVETHYNIYASLLTLAAIAAAAGMAAWPLMKGGRKNGGYGMTRTILLTAALVLAGLLPARADDTVAVAELFTSQGCSSCPPADDILQKLADDQNVIALGCHVTYWDRPSWKDTLSQSLCTERQYAYRTAMGTRRVYTPQLVVNGRTEMNGASSFSVSRAIVKGLTDAQVLRLPLRLEGGTIKTALPDIDTDGGKIVLVLFSFDNSSSTQIGRGENGGRTITYAHPVRAKEEVGVWDGRARTLDFKAPIAVTGGYALLAQNSTNGAILAAGQVLVGKD
jgi:MFS family permease